MGPDGYGSDDGVKIIVIGLIAILVLAVFLICQSTQTLPLSTLTPEREGNTVTIKAYDGLRARWSNDIDVIYLSLDEATTTIYPHARAASSWGLSKNSPQSVKIHATATIQYVNGTRELVVDQWL